MATYLTFDAGAGFFELLLELFRFVFGDTFLDGRRRAFHHVFGLFQAQTGDLTHRLNDSHLVGAEARHDDVELGLLFSRRSSFASGAAATATGAAADTPNFSSIALMRSTTSITLMFEIVSRISSVETAIVSLRLSKCYLSGYTCTAHTKYKN